MEENILNKNKKNIQKLSMDMFYIYSGSEFNQIVWLCCSDITYIVLLYAQQCRKYGRSYTYHVSFMYITYNFTTS